MKKFLASIFAAAAIATPVSAEDKVKSWRSLDSVGCMMLRECTEGVRRVNSWKDLGPEYEIAAAELDAIIQAMDKVGAAVYIADEKYFALRMRGVYDVRGNNMFLNEFYIDQPTKVIQVIRHEGWHAAQDCMAGTLNNTFTALIHPEEAVPDWIRRGAERTYPTNVLPFEAEAMWAMYVENKTVEALKVCGSSKKMWEHYTPTPLTGEWLQKKGFM
jgi:hypothetical protein